MTVNRISQGFEIPFKNSFATVSIDEDSVSIILKDLNKFFDSSLVDILYIPIDKFILHSVYHVYRQFYLCNKNIVD